MVFHSECMELIVIESSCVIVPNRYEQKGILISWGEKKNISSPFS